MKSSLAGAHFVVLLMCGVSVCSLFYGCKKTQTKPAENPISVSGTYRMSSALGVNDDGSTFVETVQDCAKANTYTFAAGAYTETTTCAPGTLHYTYSLHGDTLIIYKSTNSIYVVGKVKNLTTSGFILDANAVKWSGDIYTFLKL